MQDGVTEVICRLQTVAGKGCLQLGQRGEEQPQVVFLDGDGKGASEPNIPLALLCCCCFPTASNTLLKHCMHVSSCRTECQNPPFASNFCGWLHWKGQNRACYGRHDHEILGMM